MRGTRECECVRRRTRTRNRERTKEEIVLSVDRVEMEGKGEKMARTSQACGKEGRALRLL